MLKGIRDIDEREGDFWDKSPLSHVLGEEGKKRTLS